MFKVGKKNLLYVRYHQSPEEVQRGLPSATGDRQ